MVNIIHQGEYPCFNAEIMISCMMYEIYKCMEVLYLRNIIKILILKWTMFRSYFFQYLKETADCFCLWSEISTSLLEKTYSLKFVLACDAIPFATQCCLSLIIKLN